MPSCDSGAGPGTHWWNSLWQELSARFQVSRGRSCGPLMDFVMVETVCVFQGQQGQVLGLTGAIPSGRAAHALPVSGGRTWCLPTSLEEASSARL